MLKHEMEPKKEDLKTMVSNGQGVDSGTPAPHPNQL